MDESVVQTAVCVIGHPIAGNPAQFCTLRALAALGLEWQCLSFDVPPESLPAAIAGVDALRFAGALIAAPHQTAVAPLLQAQHLPGAVSPPRAADEAEPQPLATPWTDGLRRDAADQLVGCNFLGEAFGELLQRHEAKIGQPLRHGVFLGDPASLATAILPLAAHLPDALFVLQAAGLQPWPGRDGDAAAGQATTAEIAAPPHAGDEPATKVPVAADADAPPPGQTPVADPAAGADPADGLPGAAESEELGEPPAVLNPAEQPVLLFRWQADPAPPAKAAGRAKPAASDDPSGAPEVKQWLKQLHRDSLQIDLAPSRFQWQGQRRRSSGGVRVVSPLELEIERIAVAIHAWTGLQADHELLAEAIEEYLEI